MNFIIPITIEFLCIIPLIIIRDKEGKRKLEYNDIIKAEALFILMASILNWFCFGAKQIGWVWNGLGGYYGNNPINTIGLLWSITPPIIICLIAFLSYIIMIKIRYQINIKKDKKEKK